MTEKRKKNEIIYVHWYFSDRWGSKEESGCSIHKSISDYEKFVNIYRKKVEHNGLMPDAYHIAGKPQKVVVTHELFSKLNESDCGVRYSDEKENFLQIKKIVIIVE